MVELSGGSVNQLGYVEAVYFHNPSENTAFKTTYGLLYGGIRE
jgi:hypothetical protein